MNIDFSRFLEKVSEMKSAISEKVKDLKPPSISLTRTSNAEKQNISYELRVNNTKISLGYLSNILKIFTPRERASSQGEIKEPLAETPQNLASKSESIYSSFVVDASKGPRVKDPFDLISKEIARRMEAKGYKGYENDIKEMSQNIVDNLKQLRIEQLEKAIPAEGKTEVTDKQFLGFVDVGRKIGELIESRISQIEQRPQTISTQPEIEEPTIQEERKPSIKHKSTQDIFKEIWKGLKKEGKTGNIDEGRKAWLMADAIETFLSGNEKTKFGVGSQEYLEKLEHRFPDTTTTVTVEAMIKVLKETHVKEEAKQETPTRVEPKQENISSVQSAQTLLRESANLIFQRPQAKRAYQNDTSENKVNFEIEAKKRMRQDAELVMNFQGKTPPENFDALLDNVYKEALESANKRWDQK